MKRVILSAAANDRSGTILRSNEWRMAQRRTGNNNSNCRNKTGNINESDVLQDGDNNVETTATKQV
jgi:hypothetical protein